MSSSSLAPIRGPVGRLAEVHLVLAAARPGADAEPDQAVATLLEHQEVAEKLEALEQDVGAVRDDLPPILLPGRSDRGLHQPEVPGVEVGPDVKAVAEVIGRVFQAGASGLEDRERPLGLVGIEVPVLGAEGLAAGDHQVAVRLRPPDPATEGLVCLLVDDRVVGGAGCPGDGGRPDRRGACSDPASCRTGSGCRWPRPGSTVTSGDRVVERPAGRDLLDPDRVEAPAAGVDAVGERRLSGLTCPAGEREVAVPRGHRILVEQDLLGRLPSSPSCGPGSDTADPFRSGSSNR